MVVMHPGRIQNYTFTKIPDSLFLKRFPAAAEFNLSNSQRQPVAIILQEHSFVSLVSTVLPFIPTTLISVLSHAQELVLYDKELLNRPKMLIVTKLDKKGATSRFHDLQQKLQSIQQHG